MFSKCAFRVSGGRFQKCNWKKNLLPMIQERPLHCYIGNIPLQFNCYLMIIRHPVYNLALWSNGPVSYQSDSKFSKPFLFRGHPHHVTQSLIIPYPLPYIDMARHLHFSTSDHTLFCSIVTNLNLTTCIFCYFYIIIVGIRRRSTDIDIENFISLMFPPCW